MLVARQTRRVGRPAETKGLSFACYSPLPGGDDCRRPSPSCHPATINGPNVDLPGRTPVIGREDIAAGEMEGTFLGLSSGPWQPRLSLAQGAGPLYRDSRTPAVNPAGPLGQTIRPANLLGAGWEPHGDNGTARGRLRATQPARRIIASKQENRNSSVCCL